MSVENCESFRRRKQEDKSIVLFTTMELPLKNNERHRWWTKPQVFRSEMEKGFASSNVLTKSMFWIQSCILFCLRTTLEKVAVLSSGIPLSCIV